MTEWDARDYSRISELQRTMADEVLAALTFRGDEHVLDVGCGNGKVTAEIAKRVPQGSVLGVDPSSEMIAFASNHFGETSNLRFEVRDARRLGFHQQFDSVVSFNALHWIPEPQQDAALRSIHDAMKSAAIAQLRLVPKGERKSLEDVLEETRLSPRWNGFYPAFHDPYLHLTPEQYAAAAERCGFRVDRIHVQDKSWDFGSRNGFRAFGSVTFIEWTQHLPESDRPAFIEDVLSRYAKVAGDDKTFKFYQMDVVLRKA